MRNTFYKNKVYHIYCNITIVFNTSNKSSLKENYLKFKNWLIENINPFIPLMALLISFVGLMINIF